MTIEDQKAELEPRMFLGGASPFVDDVAIPKKHGRCVLSRDDGREVTV
jgi:hypothetical protein